MTISTRITRVSPSPSKIPYGGFSPVRLQTEILPPPSASRQELSAARIPPANKPYKRPKSKHPAHAAHRRASRSRPSTLGPSGTIAGSTGPFRPEALGSPTGYIVPSDHRLLWPHPSLSSPSTHLFIRGWLLQPLGLPRVENKRFPNLLLVSIPSCRPPMAPTVASGCASPLALAFAAFARARHPQFPHASVLVRGSVTRLQGSLYATARRVACPPPTGAFTFELSPVGSLQAGVENNYAGKQPIPAAGLAPARNKALWAASKDAKAQRIIHANFAPYPPLVFFAALRLCVSFSSLARYNEYCWNHRFRPMFVVESEEVSDHEQADI